MPLKNSAISSDGGSSFGEPTDWETDRESFHSKLRRYVSYDLLVLDDVGASKDTEWTEETLFVLVDNRYCCEKQTVFTSNQSLEGLAARIGERIVSRICGSCLVVVLDGPDRRTV